MDLTQEEKVRHIQEAIEQMSAIIQRTCDNILAAWIPAAATLEEAIKPLVEVSLRVIMVLREEYRRQGAPYGDTDEGLQQWLAALGDEARARADEEYRAMVAGAFRSWGAL